MYTTQYIERGLGGFELKLQPLMSLYGHSGTGGTRTVYPLHGMCCFEECYQEPWGTTTTNPQMYKEDNSHFRTGNTSIEGKVDWAPLHSTEGVWT